MKSFWINFRQPWGNIVFLLSEQLCLITRYNFVYYWLILNCSVFILYLIIEQIFTDNYYKTNISGWQIDFERIIQSNMTTAWFVYSLFRSTSWVLVITKEILIMITIKYTTCLLYTSLHYSTLLWSCLFTCYYGN